MLVKSKDLKTVKLAVDFSKWCQFRMEGLVGSIREEFSTHPSIGCSSGIGSSSRILQIRPSKDLTGRLHYGPRALPGLSTFGEGMFQRLWTHVTACGSMATLENKEMEAEIAGSVDYQIIMSRLRR